MSAALHDSPPERGLHIAIAGAGVLGRLLAWWLARDGHTVEVVDPAPGPQAPVPGSAGSQPVAAAFTAAGMLSPLAELDHAPPDLAALGWRSIALWHEVAAALAPQAPQRLCSARGSLLVAHASDLGSALRVLGRLRSALDASDTPWPHQPEIVSASELRVMEPALLPGLSAWRLPGEGQVAGREMLEALARQAAGVHWHWGRTALEVLPHALRLDDGRMLGCDLAIDARGLGARQGRDDAAALRGVRGEVVWLKAPGVLLRHPVRLLHPRHRVYIVPRADDHIVVGATEIESEDRSPVSLRSAVELMAAAHSVLPELAEARVVHLDVNLRPAWPDNRPRVEHAPGLLRITGLYRHGWLVAPALAQDALAQALPLKATHA